MPPGNSQFSMLKYFGSPTIGWPIWASLHTQLMRAARHRLQRQPGAGALRLSHHRVVGNGVTCALFAVLGDAHDGIVLALFLGKVESRYALASASARRAPAPSRSCAPSASERSWPKPPRRNATSQSADSRPYPCRADAPRRGRWPSLVRMTPSMPSTCRVVPEPPCTASPAGLFSDHHVVIVIKRDRFQKFAGLVVLAALRDAACPDRDAAAECARIARLRADPSARTRLPSTRN